MATEIVRYQIDKYTTAEFEIDPGSDFRPASAGQVLGEVRSAVTPAVEAAKAVLEKATEIRPDEIELRFGIKVSGSASWLIARTSGEGNFEIMLRWSRSAEKQDASEE